MVRYGNLLNRFIGGIVLPNPFDSKIEEEFCKQKFDVIHVHHPFLIGNMALYLSRKYQIPLIFTYHTRYEEYICSYAKWASLLAKIFPFYLCSFLKRCDYVFAPTEGMQEYLHDTCHVPYERLGVLPTGLCKEHYAVTDIQKADIRKKYDAEKIPLLISVSRMAQEKNVSFLINSIAKAKEAYGKPFKVLLVGEGPDKEAYQQLCREKQLEDVICFTGKIPNEEIAPYYAAADVFLFASKTETQGIVILEAFAGGTPVYALDATGVRDLVKDGVNGRLMAEDEELFADELLLFLTEQGEASYLSQNAYGTALEFQEEAVAEKAVRLYNNAVASYRKNIHSKTREIWITRNITS